MALDKFSEDFFHSFFSNHGPNNIYF